MISKSAPRTAFYELKLILSILFLHFKAQLLCRMNQFMRQSRNKILMSRINHTRDYIYFISESSTLIS